MDSYLSSCHYFKYQLMELELKMYDTVISIQEEMFYLRER